jgi:hypothetical protein
MSAFPLPTVVSAPYRNPHSDNQHYTPDVVSSVCIFILSLGYSAERVTVAECDKAPAVAVMVIV